MNSLALAAALVWLPPDGFTDWKRLEGVLRYRADLRLTVALTPAQATPEAKAVLEPFVAKGRVDLGARVPGDPVLPWVSAHPAAPRPHGALERAAEAMQAVGASGFVPGSGALESSLVEPLAASGAWWVLAGDYAAATAPWAAAGKAVFVPGRALGGEPPTSPGVWVADESGLAETVFLATLGGVPDESAPPSGWATLSQLAAAAKESGQAGPLRPAVWPDWSGAPAEPPAEGREAWEEYGAAAKAVALFQNSGQADLPALEAASAALRRAQDARFFRGEDAGRFKARLAAVYKRIGQPAPESLFGGEDADETAAPGRPTGVRSASGPGWLAFDNPPASLGDPRALRVEWDDEKIVFKLTASSASAFDVYIDLNHVLGAGSTRMLDRAGGVSARDAWEYALAISDGAARLVKTSPRGRTDEVGAYAATVANGVLTVAVPRTALRGNPRKWGFVVAAIGADERTLAGLLAPLDLQKTAHRRSGPPPRVPAVRLQR